MNIQSIARSRLTAIGSGKGGTGKTFIAVNLAHALAVRGLRVLLCDADLGLSNSGVQLGVSECGDLPRMLKGQCALADAIAYVEPSPGVHFDLLAAPAGSGALADAREEEIAHLMRQLSASRSYDHVLVDLGAGVSSAVMTAAANADETLLVLTPDPSSLTDAYAFAKLFLRRTGRVPSFVVNQTRDKLDGRHTADALTASARNFLKVTPEEWGHIPFDPKVNEAVKRQRTLAAAFPRSAALSAIETLATRFSAPRNVNVAALR